MQLTTCTLETSLGLMVAVADEEALYLLEFADRPEIETEIKRLQNRTHSPSPLSVRKTALLLSLETELHAYFEGKLQVFQTPLQFQGSPFQQSVWQTLIQIPYGETRSYADQARIIGKPSAYRAVAGANGANQLAILIPCHRIINSNGELGGYAGGIYRKKWLLTHEEKHKSSLYKC